MPSQCSGTWRWSKMWSSGFSCSTSSSTAPNGHMLISPQRAQYAVSSSASAKASEAAQEQQVVAADQFAQFVDGELLQPLAGGGGLDELTEAGERRTCGDAGGHVTTPSVRRERWRPSAAVPYGGRCPRALSGPAREDEVAWPARRSTRSQFSPSASDRFMSTSRPPTSTATPCHGVSHVPVDSPRWMPSLAVEHGWGGWTAGRSRGSARPGSRPRPCCAG